MTVFHRPSNRFIKSTVSIVLAAVLFFLFFNSPAPAEDNNIQVQDDIHSQLVKELENIADEEAALKQAHASIQARIQTLQSEYDTARKRLEFGITTQVIGMALRNQRQHMPDPDQYDTASKDYRIRLTQIGERQILLDRMIRDKSRGIRPEEKQMIQKVRSGYDRIIKLMQDIEFSKKKLLSDAHEFGRFLDRHLLWIQSSAPVSLADLKNLAAAAGVFLSLPFWQAQITIFLSSLKIRPFLWMLAAGMGFLLVVPLNKSKHRLTAIADTMGRQRKKAFMRTLEALGITFHLSIVFPYFIAAPLTVLMSQNAYSSVSAAWKSLPFGHCLILAFWTIIYHTCRPEGLAHKHFNWNTKFRTIFRRSLRWMIFFETAVILILLFMQMSLDLEFSPALGKAALLIHSIVLFFSTVSIFNFKTGITSILLKDNAGSVLCRLRYLWYPLLLLAPVCFLWQAAGGYYHSAVELHFLYHKTLVLIFFLILLSHLLLRSLKIASRNIALKNQGSEKTATDKKKITAAGAKTHIQLDDMDEQTRSLLKLTILILGFIGFWTIWAPVFPAFGILQDIRLWSYTGVSNGVEKTIPITLAGFFSSIIVILIMLTAVKNLPGLIEIILLNRLPMDAGARYAFTTVSRYVIIALGIFIALNFLGIRWSNLQWLIAALGVGLGFGLQEIVANFVSGLIVLFERPFRVGDTVTMGDVSGTVTRIRIRATTIEDWDKKELIVPNKDFITGKLINWSLSNRIVRIKIPVGIAYGSDTDLAEKLLYECAHTNPLVVSSPGPVVVFLRFGDNSLDFEVRVFIKHIDDWIPMLHQMNKAINKAMNANGITIAFPQRDVHLDAAEPIPVRIHGNSENND